MLINKLFYFNRNEKSNDLIIQFENVAYSICCDNPVTFEKFQQIFSTKEVTRYINYIIFFFLKIIKDSLMFISNKLHLQFLYLIIRFFAYLCYRLQINYFDESMKKIWDTSHPFKSWNSSQTSAIQGNFNIVILPNNNFINLFLSINDYFATFSIFIKTI